MLNYKFDKGLVRTTELAEKLSIPEGTLDYWKYQWKQDGHDTYEMGLRLIGNKAYFDPVQFVNWVSQNKLTNKPTSPEEKLDQQKLIAFVSRNVEIKKEIRS
jgi:hypothetical protein